MQLCYANLQMSRSINKESEYEVYVAILSFVNLITVMQNLLKTAKNVPSMSWIFHPTQLYWQSCTACSVFRWLELSFVFLCHLIHSYYKIWKLLFFWYKLYLTSILLVYLYQQITIWSGYRTKWQKCNKIKITHHIICIYNSVTILIVFNKK